MFFDSLIGICERHYPEVLSTLERAKIFSFPEIPHKVLPKEFTEDSDWLEDNFFLPFPITAIEDKASCVILIDTEKKQRGALGVRRFIECMPFASDHEAFREWDTDRERCIADHQIAQDTIQQDPSFKKTFLVSFGFIDSMRIVDSRNFLGAGELVMCELLNKKEKKLTGLHAFTGITNDGVLRNVYSTMQEVLYFNNPTNFILESKIIKGKQKKKGKKVARSFERPIYTILKPNEIREKIHLPTQHGEHNSPVPHDRRRHDRWLSSEKYNRDKDSKPREKKIIPYGRRKGESYYLHVDVPATWIGPSESTVGNKRYRVILDR